MGRRQVVSEAAGNKNAVGAGNKSAGSTVGIGAMKLGGFGAVDVPDPDMLDFADLASQVAKGNGVSAVGQEKEKEAQTSGGFFKHQQNIILREDTDI